ncbi:conserved hypothetical protein [Culex quinquefasciatus]|uniref:Uncharacterized protein n=1 Tax=Culex quinquefasciatus TaxID=7176 RepID=B0WIB6_CULQU|nr:conserved hypothetical protein [Culex quinquefasciatus]|eukprot:XP_001848450.1 conserved hypothetical protein [Culex quinquefasciatus]
MAGDGEIGVTPLVAAVELAGCGSGCNQFRDCSIGSDFGITFPPDGGMCFDRPGRMLVFGCNKGRDTVSRNISGKNRIVVCNACPLRFVGKHPRWRNPESRIQNPESRIQNPESRIQNPESRIQSPESRNQNPEPRIKNPESRNQNPESRIQNPESRVQNPESRIQNPES